MMKTGLFCVSFIAAAAFLSCAGTSEPVAAGDASGSASASGSRAEASGLDSGGTAAVAAAPAPETEKPRVRVRFSAKKADGEPSSPIPPGVGQFVSSSSLSAGRRNALTAAFRDAYLEARGRGIPLSGVLGGDVVHAWTLPALKKTPQKTAPAADDPALPVTAGAYAQNWREDRVPVNSWGLKDMAIACAQLEGDRVFLVRGPLLDAYGQGKGRGGANGIAGYGAPLGDEFSSEEGVAQRFEYGLLLVRADRSFAFLPGAAPSSGGVPEGVGSASPQLPSPVRVAFRSAWAAAVNSGRGGPEPDGPVLSSRGAWGSVSVQTFGSSSWAIVLPLKEDGLPAARARILDKSFVEAVAGGIDGRSFDFSEYGMPIGDSFASGGVRVQLFEKGRMETAP